MKSEAWKTYRTRFLVKAKQLSSTLSFTDQLGRQHCGRKGDYLVESSDGVISIAPRRIFEDIYVPMSLRGQPAGEATIKERTIKETTISEPQLDCRTFEALEIEDVKLGKRPISQSRVDEKLPVRHDVLRPHTVVQLEAARGRRKLPQPCRDRRASTPRLGLM
jgi:hypothetical protein